MRVIERGVSEQPMTKLNFEELKRAGLELSDYMEGKRFEIRGDPQELPDRQRISDLKTEVIRVSYSIAALAKRFKEPGAKIVSWKEYVDAKAEAQAVLERIRNLNA